jgi:hypothetical protein
MQVRRFWETKVNLWMRSEFVNHCEGMNLYERRESLRTIVLIVHSNIK